jgi:hypothetical protein
MLKSILTLSVLLLPFLLDRSILYSIKTQHSRPPEVKGIVRPFERGGETRLIRSNVVNWRPGKFFFLNFNNAIS